MLDEFSLQGKTAIVASCGSPWTKGIAASLQQAGAKLVVASSDRACLDEISAALPEEAVLCIPADLTSSREVDDVVEQTMSRFCGIDILVNDFNRELWKPMLDITEKEWHEVLYANATAVYLCARAAGRHMVTNKSGSIVSVISALAERGIEGGTAYCASLGAVVELTRALALEWAHDNVRVNAVQVGWAEKPVEGKDIMARYIPAQRRTRAADVAPLVAFLASDAASYMDGCIYTVDGGLMARA